MARRMCQSHTTLILPNEILTSPGPQNVSISQFVDLVIADDAIAPPVAILGLTFNFVQWLSTTVLENEYAT